MAVKACSARRTLHKGRRWLLRFSLAPFIRGRPVNAANYADLPTAKSTSCSNSPGTVGITQRSAYWCGAKRRRTPASAASRRNSARTAALDQARAPRVGPSITAPADERDQTFWGVVGITARDRSTVEHELALRPGCSAQARMPPTARPAPRGERRGPLVLTAGPVPYFYGRYPAGPVDASPSDWTRTGAIPVLLRADPTE